MRGNCGMFVVSCGTIVPRYRAVCLIWREGGKGRWEGGGEKGIPLRGRLRKRADEITVPSAKHENRWNAGRCFWWLGRHYGTMALRLGVAVFQLLG